MAGFRKDKNGYPKWNDSNRLLHRDIAMNMVGVIFLPIDLCTTWMETRVISKETICAL